MTTNLKISDFIEVGIVLIIGIGSIYNTMTSRKISNAVRRYNDLISYNKVRIDLAEKLRQDTKSISRSDKISITITNRILSTLSCIEQYKCFLNVSERAALFTAKNLLERDNLDVKDKKKLLKFLNYFYGKLSKGDIII